METAQGAEEDDCIPWGSGLNTIRAAKYMIKATHPKDCKFSGSEG
jgi:hypothetical protein